MTRILLVTIAVLATSAAAAFGGTDERWLRAADELTVPVLAPTKTLGMTLKGVRPQHVDCGETREQLDASYGAGEQQKLTILEGQPAYCADLGDAPVLGTYRVHGRGRRSTPTARAPGASGPRTRSRSNGESVASRSS